MRHVALALVAVVTGATAAPAPKVAQADIPHASIAGAYVESHGLSGTRPESVDLEAFLGEHHLTLRVGAFVARFPLEDMADAAVVGEVQEVALALVVLQEHFLEWTGREEEALDADVAAVKAWIEGWSPRKIAQERPVSTEAFLAATRAAEAEDALARFADAMLVTGAERIASPAELIFMPDRESFVSFVCFAGWLYPSAQSGFWAPDLASWTQCRLNDAEIIALQFSDPGSPRYSSGISMDAKTPTGMRQQVSQLAALELFDALFGESLPAPIAGGLAMNLVIDLYGEVDTRVDGDLSSRQTSARQVFVPGGLAQGGQLAKNAADSRWRAAQGRHRFVRVLKSAQKEGTREQKKNRTKNAHFLLESFDQKERYVVTAPFFGSTVHPPSPPDEVRGDYAEFLRSYKCAFTYWLATEAAGKKESPARFADLLARLEAEEGADFAAIVAEVYEAPLSGEELDRKSLEGRFLGWISKQKGSR